MMAKSRSSDERCPHCGRTQHEELRDSEVPIKKGHVQRAIRAADGVYSVATKDATVESGVVLMTAVLLVERLAMAHRGEYSTVLNEIARCFELKRGLLSGTKNTN